VATALWENARPFVRPKRKKKQQKTKKQNKTTKEKEKNPKEQKPKRERLSKINSHLSWRFATLQAVKRRASLPTGRMGGEVSADTEATARFRLKVLGPSEYTPDYVVRGAEPVPYFERHLVFPIPPHFFRAATPLASEMTHGAPHAFASESTKSVPPDP